jgi:hypothetical protein
MTTLFLEQLVTNTLETLNESARETYINALKQSLRIDANFIPSPGTFPKISTPQDIARDGLSVDDQYKLRVSTLKPVALEFLIHDAHIPERGLRKTLRTTSTLHSPKTVDHDAHLRRMAAFGA